jgi:hypothetical protein
MSNIVALATKILENAKALESYHNEHGLSLPTFDEHGGTSQHYPIPQEKTRATISDACEELNALVQGPMKMMQTRATVSCSYRL